MRRLKVYRKEDNEDIGNRVKTVKATEQQLVMLQVVPTWSYVTWNILGIISMLLVNNQKQICINIFFAETLYVVPQNFLTFWTISKFPDFFRNLLFPDPWQAWVTFDLENSKIKIIAKVKPDGYIWGLKFNRYVCFSFRGNQTILGWDIANSIFDLENQGQGHGQG